jgi:AbrB family looped-hinge helix DNA binding protein
MECEVEPSHGGKKYMSVVKTSSKGQVVIPKAIREKLGITPGRKVLFRLVGNRAEISPLPEDPVKALRGVLKGGPSLASELVRERKEDNRIDEKHRS